MSDAREEKERLGCRSAASGSNRAGAKWCAVRLCRRAFEHNGRSAQSAGDRACKGGYSGVYGADIAQRTFSLELRQGAYLQAQGFTQALRHFGLCKKAVLPEIRHGTMRTQGEQYRKAPRMPFGTHRPLGLNLAAAGA
jgi:hypothetical protein